MGQQHQGGPGLRQVGNGLLLCLADQRQDQLGYGGLICSHGSLRGLLVAKRETKRGSSHLNSVLWEVQTKEEICSVWPRGLASKEQRVGLKGHGAVRRGLCFGKNEADQHVKANVVGCEVAAAEEAGDEAQQTGEEELQEERSISRSGGKTEAQDCLTCSGDSPAQTASWWTSLWWIPELGHDPWCCQTPMEEKKRVKRAAKHRESYFFVLTGDNVPFAPSPEWASLAAWCSPPGAVKRWSEGGGGSKEPTKMNSESAAKPSGGTNRHN